MLNKIIGKVINARDLDEFNGLEKNKELIVILYNFDNKNDDTVKIRILAADESYLMGENNRKLI